MTLAKSKSSAEPRPKWTLERYHHAISSGVITGWNVELLDGELFEMPPEGPLHSGRIGITGRYLQSIIPAHLAWLRFGNPITLKNSEPEPDIAIVRPDPGEYLDRHPGLDDILLIIEFADSSLDKDKDGKKYKSYAKENIADYWVADLKNKALVVNRVPQNETYLSQNTFHTGSVKPLLLDISIEVKQLLGRNQ